MKKAATVVRKIRSPLVYNAVRSSQTMCRMFTNSRKAPDLEYTRELIHLIW